jgi:hypothetical protein
MMKAGTLSAGMLARMDLSMKGAPPPGHYRPGEAPAQLWE